MTEECGMESTEVMLEQSAPQALCRCPLPSANLDFRVYFLT